MPDDILFIAGLDVDLTQTSLHMGDKIPERVMKLYELEQIALKQKKQSLRESMLKKVYAEFRKNFLRQPNELEQLIKKYSQEPHNIVFGYVTFNDQRFLLEFILRALLGQEWQNYIAPERIIHRKFTHDPKEARKWRQEKDPLYQIETKAPYISALINAVKERYPEKKVEFVLVDDSPEHCTIARALGHSAISVSRRIANKLHLLTLTNMIENFLHPQVEEEVIVASESVEEGCSSAVNEIEIKEITLVTEISASSQASLSFAATRGFYAPTPIVRKTPSFLSRSTSALDEDSGSEDSETTIFSRYAKTPPPKFIYTSCSGETRGPTSPIPDLTNRKTIRAS